VAGPKKYKYIKKYNTNTYDTKYTPPSGVFSFPDGKPVCKVKCELKPHATINGACINGKDCLYKHADTTATQKKCAQLFPPPALKIDKSADAIVYSPIFDAILGFSGEGPITVATYNMN
jgi:hypothetical protein